MKSYLLRKLCIFIVIGVAQLRAQAMPGHELTDFVQANERFGWKLMREVHAKNPNENVVLAPLPVSYIFGAISEGSVMGATKDEIRNTFEWNGLAITRPSRLLFQRFEPPKLNPVTLRTSKIKTSRTPNRDNWTGSLDGMWMSTAFIYRGRGTVSEFFLGTARREFGMEIFNTATMVEPIAKKWWKDYIPQPSVIGTSDFYVTGMFHLQALWAGNTFSHGTIHKGEFFLRSGERKSVEMMPSEFSSYFHAKTENLEAIMLQCHTVTLLIVLPAPSMDIFQLENTLVKHPENIDPMLHSEVGDVELPKLKIQLEEDLTPALQQMGVRRVFSDLDIVQVPQSHLKHVVQKVELEIDENGIRANAGTIVNGVYGGIMGGMPTPFHMKVNRPFVFLVRDNLTNSLVYLGAVMDPSNVD